MASYVNETFEKKEIILDGNNYKNCEFIECVIIYEGGTLPNLEFNNFMSCRWSFNGAASRAVAFMKALYNGGGRGVVDAIIATIKSEEIKNEQGEED